MPEFECRKRRFGCGCCRGPWHPVQAESIVTIKQRFSTTKIRAIVSVWQSDPSSHGIHSTGSVLAKWTSLGRVGKGSGCEVNAIVPVIK